MKSYIGTKAITAKPMNRAEYNKYREWELPADENGDDEGYLVEYTDSDSNHINHQGYISWSPKKQFEDAYRETEGLTFGLAIDALKQGLKVARKGWNGKGMFCFLVPGSEYKANRSPTLEIFGEGNLVKQRPHIDLKTADGSIATWSPSGSDALAEDWIIVE